MNEWTTPSLGATVVTSGVSLNGWCLHVKPVTHGYQEQRIMAQKNISNLFYQITSMLKTEYTN